jgi:hypothetical protein
MNPLYYGRWASEGNALFTTNKSLKAWGRVLHDDDLAQAILDRVLEPGRLLRLDGPSVRTLHVNLDEAMKEDFRSGDRPGQNFRKKAVRVSGTRGTITGGMAVGHFEVDGQGALRRVDESPRELTPIFDVTQHASTVMFSPKGHH